MSVSILSRPTKSGSNWNALGNPVIFKLRRVDHTYNQINNNGGNIQVQINGVNVTSYYQIGNTVYVLSSSGGTVEVTGTITASAFSGGNTLVTINVAYSASTGGTINNLSKRTDYRIEYNFKSVDDDEELLDAELAVSSASNGIMLVSASLLKNLLTASWSLPSGVNEADADGSIGFYLSYQEYYDGVLQGSVTNDNANPIYGLLGANQIGYAHGSNMLDYFLVDDTKKFLTRFHLSDALSGLRIWRDWPFTLSFIWPTGISGLVRFVDQYDAEGNTSGHSEDSLISNVGSVVRIKLPEITPTTKTVNLKIVNNTTENADVPNQSFENPWTNVDFPGASLPWDFSVPGQMNLLSFGGTQESDYARSDPFTSGPITQNTNIHITLNFTIAAGHTLRIKLYAWDGSQRSQLSSSAVLTDANTSLDIVGIIAPFDFDVLEIRVTSVSGAGGNFVMTDIPVFEYFPYEDLTEIVEVNVEDTCNYNENNIPIPWKNPILLQWKNSNGGDAMWMFPMVHEYMFTYQDGRKARRLTLFDINLNPVQWEAINELNSANEFYRPPIIDLDNTNTINSTAKQIGKQVCMVAQDGKTTGVIVIPSNNKLLSRQIKHSISIEIELPETIDV